MDGFDREALTAKAGKSGNGKWFWASIAALPVVGIAAGLALGMGGSTPDPIKGIDMPERAVMMAEAPTPQPVQVALREPVFSASSEVDKYRATYSTLVQCGANLDARDNHWKKSADNYRKANEDKARQLQSAAMEERKQASLARVNRHIPDSDIAIMAGAMTGQLQRDMAKEVAVITAELNSYDELRWGYLGQNPSNADCINFRNEVIMGKHNVRLG